MSLSLSLTNAHTNTHTHTKWKYTLSCLMSHPIVMVIVGTDRKKEKYGKDRKKHNQIDREMEIGTKIESNIEKEINGEKEKE